MVIVPAILVQLAKHPVEREYDLSSLRLIRCGAAPLSQSTVDFMQQKLSCFILQAYGMTESTHASHSNTFAFQRDRSIGVVMPFCESVVTFISLFFNPRADNNFIFLNISTRRLLMLKRMSPSVRMKKEKSACAVLW